MLTGPVPAAPGFGGPLHRGPFCWLANCTAALTFSAELTKLLYGLVRNLEKTMPRLIRNKGNGTLRCSAAAASVLLAFLVQATAVKAQEPAAPAIPAPCSDAGLGYLALPGTDTCLRVRGSMSLEASSSFGNRQAILNSGYNGPLPTVSYSLGPIEDPAMQTSADGTISVSGEAQTDLGYLETYVELRGTYQDGSLNPARVSSAYVELGLWAAGLRSSNFDFYSGYTQEGGYVPSQTTLVAAYSAELPNDTFLTISLEDGQIRQATDGIWSQYGATDLPDFIAALDYYGESDTLHAALAAHRLSDLRSDERIWSWAATAGWEHRFQSTDQLLLIGAYSEGATGYLGAPFYSTDFILDSSGRMVPTRGLSATASFKHAWSSQWISAATASAYWTQTPTELLTWNTSGGVIALGTEYVPVPGVTVGAEASVDWDRLAATSAGSDLPPAENLYLSTRLYASAGF